MATEESLAAFVAAAAMPPSATVAETAPILMALNATPAPVFRAPKPTRPVVMAAVCRPRSDRCARAMSFSIGLSASPAEVFTLSREVFAPAARRPKPARASVRPPRLNFVLISGVADIP